MCWATDPRPDSAHRHWCERRPGTLDAITHDAVTVTSQYEDHYRQETGWSVCSTNPAPAKYEHRLARPISRPRAICARPAPPAPSMRSNARWTSSRLRSSSIRSGCACGAIRIATSTMIGRTAARQLRECYRQGAGAFGWDKRTQGRARCAVASDLVAGSMATGDLGSCRCPSGPYLLTADGQYRGACAIDISTGTHPIMAQVAAGMLGLPLDNISIDWATEHSRNRQSRADRRIAASVSRRNRDEAVGLVGDQSPSSAAHTAVLRSSAGRQAGNAGSQTGRGSSVP